MADVTGRCRDLDYCSIGQMRTLVRIPLGRPFICPECGKPLREPVLMNAPMSRKRIAVWSVGTLGLFVLLYECVAPSGRHTTLSPSAQRQIAARIAALQAPAPRPPLLPKPVAKPAPVLPAPIRPAPVPVPPVPLAVAPALPPPPAPIPAAPIPLVLGPPVPETLANPPLIRMPPPSAEAPAKPKPPESAGVKVTMECSVDAAGVPSNCTPVKLQPPPPKHAPAPPPADREPSQLPIAGGTPPYPLDYVRDGRAGEVSVDCTIDPDGEPEHCRVRDLLGGRRFAEATVNWLNSGTVRFAPAMRNGVPVAEERRWRIAFPPR
jgi:hypothetical protein